MRRHAKAATAVPNQRRVEVLGHLGTRALLAALLASLWVLAFASSPASALVAYAHRGEISGPGPGVHFESKSLKSESVAVSDFNHHIYVADSNRGKVYDFASISDTAPTVWEGFNAGNIAVAVQSSTGDIYVADATDAVIEKFDADGNPIATWASGGVLNGASTPADSFLPPEPGIDVGTFGIAVDQASGDLYVIDAGHNVVDVFDSSGAYLSQREPSGVSFGPAYTEGIALADSSGRLYVSDSASPPHVDVFEIAGGYLERLEGSNTPPGNFGEGFVSVAANDTTGDFYVSDTKHEVVNRFASSGAFLDRITGVPGGPFSGLAVDQASGDLYVAGNASGTIKIFSGKPVVLPDVETETASAIQPNDAVLNGTVNPDEAPLTECVFEWGESDAFGHSAPCEAPDAAGVGAGNSPVAVHAHIEGLSPGITYHYRLTAANANGLNPGEAPQNRTFTAAGARIDSTSVSNVSVSAATLEAEIDPNGSPTTYFFEYGTSIAYGLSAPLPPGLAIGSTQEVEVATHVQGLSAATTYHYRVIARSELSPGVFREFPGPDRTFITQFTIGAAGLPDSRQWQLVSPPDKHGALLEPIGETGVIQASANGDAISYLANAPTETQPQGYSNLIQILSRRLPAGWETKDIASPHAAATGASIGIGQEYRFFSEDLSRSVVQPAGDFLPLSTAASEQTPYLRTNFFAGDVGDPCTTNCYRPLITGCPAIGPCPQPIEEIANVPAGTVFGNNRTDGGCGPVVKLERRVCHPAFVAATPDLSHVLIGSEIDLTPGMPGATSNDLYEWSAGALTRVGAMGEDQRDFHAISTDGSRIVFDGASEGKNGLLLRDTSAGKTLKLDQAETGCATCQSGGAQFRQATPDASRIYFTSPRKLTPDSGAGDGKPDLYECHILEAGSGPECELTDLTPGGNAQGVLGVSPDGAFLYYAAGPANEPHVYLRHEGASTLIGVLSSLDETDWRPKLKGHTSRTSPDGHWLTFLSQQPLTGYDNRDAITGEPDMEVYLYDAETNQLRCASCSPTGARPVGIEYSKIKYGEGGLTGGDRILQPQQGVAAIILGGTPISAGWALYQSRYLSNSGRLFFNSHDALVPSDTNGTMDVYEYEPPKVGDCATSSPTFSSLSGGCVSLISSGTSPLESAFLDASESGDDVFFFTSSRLSPLDTDGERDVYDAQRCGVPGSPSCLPAPPSPPPACEGDACQNPAAPPNDPTPSSLGFRGDGNVKAPRKAKKKKRSRKHSRAKHKAKAHKSKRAHARAANNDRRAGR